MIFINEAEYFIKQVAAMRAIESMYCYEYYLPRNSTLADLGKNIPERLCKHDSIQKDLARTSGLIMFVRMLSAMFGAVPLGLIADRYGRKPVLVLHKVNVVITCSSWLALCMAPLLARRLCDRVFLLTVTCRSRISQGSNLVFIPFGITWTYWRQLRCRSGHVVRVVHRRHSICY